MKLTMRQINIQKYFMLWYFNKITKQGYMLFLNKCSRENPSYI